MKYLFLLVLAVLLIMPASAFADVGIGLKWVTEAEAVKEDAQTCINYFLYNPFDQDVNGYLEALGELEELSVAEEPKIIPSGTSSKEAIPTEICFDIPKVYEETCLLGPFLCERKCEEEQVVYTGEVQSAYNLNFAGGTGSSTGSSISARMKLIVNCEKVEMDVLTGMITQPTSIYIGVAVLIIIIAFVYRRKRSGTSYSRGYEFKPHKNPWN